MVRNILGVIVGYLAMGLFVFASFSILYMVLKAEGAYKPEVWDLSTTWIIASIPIGLVAAVIGGAICRLISKKRGAVMALAIAVFVLGAASAAYQLTKDAPTDPRPEGVSMMDASAKAVQPAWLAIANPIIGVIGVGIGGCLLFGSKGDTRAATDES